VQPREAVPNYITRDGAKKLQEELVDLRHRQRPAVVRDVADAAAQGDRSENAEYIYGKRKLREIDRRIEWLTKRLERATVVDPRSPPGNDDGDAAAAFFGAFVDVEDESGAPFCYRIVGEDEVDVERGHVSWRSPIGRALLKKRAGDTVVFRRPAPRPDLHPTAPPAILEAELVVVRVRY
jgi:transcription elongation factor GreB